MVWPHQLNSTMLSMPVLKRQGINPKKIAIRLRLKTSRIRAYIWPTGMEDPVSGFCFLSDLEDISASFFMRERLPNHHNVQLSFISKDAVAYRGTVAWCRSYRISGSDTFRNAATYRVKVRLRFGSEAERRRYLAFVEGLNEKVSIIKPGMKF